jgi:hypothetical protein
MPRVPEGGFALPSRLVHERRIQLWRARAYYDVLHEDEKFRQDLENLLNRWTWTGAEKFAKLWGLPERGPADLAWTHSLWRQRRPKRVSLRVGLRSYPGLEDDADEVEARRLGYRHHPPWLRNQKSLRLGALRLYRRAVLKWPWKAIAEAEGPDKGWSVHQKSVWDGVRRWGMALGVPLPEVPSGRPRKPSRV